MNIAVQTRESSERAANASEVELIASSENHPVAHTLEPDPIEIDPRPCERCGRTIDQHECIDTPEGPEFYCFPDDDIVTCWELADPGTAGATPASKPRRQASAIRTSYRRHRPYQHTTERRKRPATHFGLSSTFAIRRASRHGWPTIRVTRAICSSFWRASKCHRPKP